MDLMTVLNGMRAATYAYMENYNKLKENEANENSGTVLDSDC